MFWLRTRIRVWDCQRRVWDGQGRVWDGQGRVWDGQGRFGDGQGQKAHLGLVFRSAFVTVLASIPDAGTNAAL